MYKILICDDERDIRNALRIYLTGEGYAVCEADSGLAALELMQREEVQLVLMDIMMPGMDGMTATAKLREQSNVPVILITAKSEDNDKILGLTVGADDYITKPFNPLEVLARVKAQLRRQRYQASPAQDTGSVLTAGPLSLDKESGRVYKDGREIALTGREFLLLSYLMENTDKIISKERLYEQVWGEASSICDNTIMVHIRHIREKTETDPSRPQQLITVKGLGYKLRKRIK